MKFAVVGLRFVDQHTPLTNTIELPSEVTFPPAVAVVCAIELIIVVVTVGITGVTNVEKTISAP